MWTRFRAIISRLRFMLERRRLDDELQIEVDGHLDALTGHFERQGMSRDEAYLAARRQFGNPLLLRQHVHEMNGIAWIEQAAQDLRHAIRQLGRTPSFAAIVIITLALGIGTTTAIFSVVEAVLVRPLPYVNSDRIVRIVERPAQPVNEIGYQQSLAAIWTRDLPVLRAQAPSLSHVGLSTAAAATVIDPANVPQRIDGVRVSPAVLEMLGARPALGRIFTDAEEAPSTEPIAVISHPMWQQHFGGAADILGRSLLVDDQPATIVGVMPRGFQYPDAQTQFWAPFMLGGRLMRIAPIARLADGVTIEAASANVEAVLRQIRTTEPRSPGARSTADARFELHTIQDYLVSPVRPLLLVLASAVGFVLLIACVNVTNLLLNRNAARRQELAVRVALGATSGRLVRYVLTETMLVASLGGAAGVALAVGAVKLLRTLGTSLARRDLTPGVSIPRLEEIQINTSALMFAIAITISVGVLVGLLPIIRYALARHLDALKAGVQSLASVQAGPSRGGRAIILVTQTALATVALIGGGLLVHSFLKLSAVDPGYEPSHLLTFSIRSSTLAGNIPLLEDATDRFRALPGVKAAGYAELLPMVRFRTGGPLAPAQPMPEGTPPPPSPLDMRTVSHDFVRAMGMRIVAGRALSPDREREVLMNETLARSGFLGPNVIGQYVMVAGRPDPFEVVGIVADVRQYGLDQDPDPQVFVDARQLPPGNPSPYFALRVGGNPGDYVVRVREAVHEIDPSAALVNVATMQEILSNGLSRPRLFAVLAAAFAAIAALLAAVGVCGVTAYAVTQRTRELAIRLALGARPGELLLLTIRQGVGWTMIGLLIGIAGSVMLSRYLEGVLYGITPLDLTTFAVVATMFLAVALVATWIPARRTARVDPVVALRTP